MVGIYKITSPSNKVYIGQAININYRWRQYKKLHCKTQTKLYNSLYKHEPKNHKFELIEECEINQLDEKETYYKKIELDKVKGDWSKVLFCGLYDKGGGPKSEEHKNKISISNRKPKSHTHRKNMSIGKKGLNYKVYHGINQYDLDDNFIKEWNSIKEITKQYNIKSQSISNNLNKLTNTSGGFKFKYKNQLT